LRSIKVAKIEYLADGSIVTIDPYDKEVVK
jgi:hypothetical protein